MGLPSAALLHRAATLTTETQASGTVTRSGFRPQGKKERKTKRRSARQEGGSRASCHSPRRELVRQKKRKTRKKRGRICVVSYFFFLCACHLHGWERQSGVEVDEGGCLGVRSSSGNVRVSTSRSSFFWGKGVATADTTSFWFALVASGIAKMIQDKTKPPLGESLVCVCVCVCLCVCVCVEFCLVSVRSLNSRAPSLSLFLSLSLSACGSSISLCIDPSRYVYVCLLVRVCGSMRCSVVLFFVAIYLPDCNLP